MNADQNPKLLDAALTDVILRAFYAVYNELGSGFIEGVYESAQAIEFQAREVPFLEQMDLRVFYRGHPVGAFRPDFVVGDRVIVEVKAVSALTGAHESQLVNYLMATGMQVGLLLNFGAKPEFRRRVWSKT
jgi:GxxExxY protein